MCIFAKVIKFSIALKSFQVFLCMTVAFLLYSLSARAETYTVSGVVTDSLTHEALPFASVMLGKKGPGALTDSNGNFVLTTSRPPRTLTASAMGFSSKTVSLASGKLQKLQIQLHSSGVELSNLTVRPGGERYSKKNNPAVDFAKALRNAKDKGNPMRKPNYNYNKYERISVALDNYSSHPKGSRQEFLNQYTDTSILTGKPILNVAVREKISSVYHRLTPESQKEYVRALRHSGLDDILDPKTSQGFYEDVMREVDLYDGDIVLLQQRFVSPLSRIAPDFYKFYLTDTVRIDSIDCVELTFVPRNPRTLGFTGRIYVAKDDSTMFVRRVKLRAAHDINLNYVQDLQIEQEFKQASDGSRLKVSDEMIVTAQLMPGTNPLYGRRVSRYASHDFNPSPMPDLFSVAGSQIFAPEAMRQERAYWDRNRMSEITHGEKNMEGMMTGLRRDPFFYWAEKVARVLVTSYIPTGKNSKFDFGPVTSLYSSNSIEGARMRIGGMTTANLSPRWFSRGYIARGFKDHKWKYGLQLEHSFEKKNYHAIEFPIHAIRASHVFDMNMLGQGFTANNQDNIFMSVKRSQDLQMTYRRASALEYILETRSNFSMTARVKSERQYPTAFMPFTLGSGDELSHYTLNSVGIELRYAPGEKFLQNVNGRKSINFDAPVFTLGHTFAPHGALGNRYALSLTEGSFAKRFWFSAFGYTDIYIKAGKVWSQSPYPNLIIPPACLSYFIQPKTFACLDPMEFINDSYIQWDAIYWANGALFNYIPGFNRLGLREVLSFRGFWGGLSKRNNPEYHHQLFLFPEIAACRKLDRGPYMEAGVGIDNLFKILRVDYVWRLNYLDHPGVDRGGIRLMVHIGL